MNIRIRCISLFVAALCAALPLHAAGAGELQAREFAIGESAVLSMDVDSSWKQTRPPETLALISIESKTPGRLHILVTPLPAAADRIETEGLRSYVQKMADRIAPRTMEKDLTLTGMRGRDTDGFYFHATDSAYKSGEYRYMYQGGVLTNGVFVTFTVMYNEGAEQDAKTALASIEKLRLIERRDPVF